MATKGKSVTVAAHARCTGCGEPPATEAALKRGRCEKCYDKWVRAKPVGVGAVCVGCGERRRDVLRQFELSRMFVVVCHNCAQRAKKLGASMPRSVEGLRVKLLRDRRWGDRRADAVVGGTRSRKGNERRRDDRRVSERSAFDATDLAVMEVEIEAEYASPAEDRRRDSTDPDITGIHQKLDESEL